MVLLEDSSDNFKEAGITFGCANQSFSVFGKHHYSCNNFLLECHMLKSI